jgi:hypothetical protein
MVEVVGLLLVFVLSVTVATGAALAVLSVLLVIMRRTAVRLSSASLVPCRNRPLDAPLLRRPGILSQPRRRRTARGRALWFLADPAARRVGSALTVFSRQPPLHRTARDTRRHGLTINRVGVPRMVDASRQAARSGLLGARTHVNG